LYNELWSLLTKIVQQATKGFVQLGHDVEAIIGSAHPGFIFGGHNSAGQ
jgi:hypothetical protein